MISNLVSGRKLHYSFFIRSLLLELVLSNVDLWRLHQVKLFIGGLFHEVEHRVFEHVLNHVSERVVHEIHLATQVFVLVARQLLELVLVASTLTERQDVKLVGLGQVSVDALSGRRVKVTRDHLVDDLAAGVAARIEQLFHFRIIEDVIDHLVEHVGEQCLILARLNRVNFLLL